MAVAMRSLILLCAGVATLPPAAAADELGAAPAFTVSGNAILASDYRKRGISQSDGDLGVRGDLTLRHRSGAYARAFAANRGGWGSHGGAAVELALTGGWRGDALGGTIDAGVTWTMFPGGRPRTDYAELFSKLSGTVGPLQLLAGAAYAPPQVALGDWSRSPASRFGASGDNLWLWGDASAGVPGTPLTLKAHLGHSIGSRGLGPDGTGLAPTGAYWDYLVGIDWAVFGGVTMGLDYVGTDITARRAATLQPEFSTRRNGGGIAGGKVVISLSAGF